ncbi:MAG: transporter [Cohnella sp.]|nr:transporter [Cohnella sp.]
MEPLLRMSNISKTYPGVKALDQVELAVQPGEVHALIGENGAGKSTLMKILVGVESSDDGAEIIFAGEKIRFNRPIEATLKGISMIYQDLSLFPNLSVAENICIGRESASKSYSRVQWKHMRTLAEKALAELGLKVDVSLPLERLSIAKQQLVAIARSLVFDSKLIIMDEPTSSLSSGEVEQLYKIIADLRKKGISIIYISHKLKELFAVADRFTVLRDGKFVGSYDKEHLDEDKLISLMVGRHLELHAETAAAREIHLGEEVLRVEGLSKKGNFKDISFSVRAGEIVGITGLVGAGRTELAQALFGLNKPDSGRMYISGKKVDIKSSGHAVKHKMAYIPESRQTQGLFLRQSLIDNISVTVFGKMLNNIKLIDRSKEKKLANEYIQILDVRPPMAEMNAGQLSGGNQQKIVIAKWLSTEPKILIIDEPTNGIDIGAKTEIHKLLRRLTNKGIGIIVISSELPEVLAISDRVLVMRRGRISGELAAAEATQENIMNLAVLGAKAKAGGRP